MAATNDITGDKICTKGVTTDAYRDSWERIFGNNRDKQAECEEPNTPSSDEVEQTDVK